MIRNLVIGVLCLLFIAVSVQAQSGRRQVKPPPAAAPVPTPTPEPSPEAKQKEEAELVFLVASERNSMYTNIPLYYYEVARRACGDRLRTRSTADVDVAERDMTRGEAIEKAKSAKKTYVVLLSLTFDNMSNNHEDVQLDFLLLEPMTAKVVLTGRAYLNSNRKSPVIINPGRVSGLYREQLLRDAGQEVADRILRKMKISH
ncbi:MAG TPA: hypothetical protein VN644_03745 [Pyrinomonadaceae bacterium]|nr:hypothetical protein [Pyrinomonadaceae bacterium]